MLEVRAVNPPVAREQPVGLAKRVRSDQKVCGHARSQATPLAIGLPHPPGLDGRIDIERTELDSKFAKDLLSYRARRETPCNLRPDDIAGHNLTCGDTGLEDFSGVQAERRVAEGKIEDDAAIDGGNHLNILLREAVP